MVIVSVSWAYPLKIQTPRTYPQTASWIKTPPRPLPKTFSTSPCHAGSYMETASRFQQADDKLQYLKVLEKKFDSMIWMATTGRTRSEEYKHSLRQKDSKGPELQNA